MVLLDPDEDEFYGLNSERLEQAEPHLLTETEPISPTSAPPEATSETEPNHLGPTEHGSVILIENLDPNHTHFVNDEFNSFVASPESCSGGGRAMTDPNEDVVEKPIVGGVTGPSGTFVDLLHAESVVSTLVSTAAHANSVLEHAATSQARGQPSELPPKRADAAQDVVAQSNPEERSHHAGRASPPRAPRHNGEGDTIATSPTLRKHVITIPEGTIETLPAFQQTSPASYGFTTSPQAEKLPPISQLTGQRPAGQIPPGQLNEFVEIALQQDPRSSHQQNRSFGPATVQSPMMQYHPYPTNVQASPPSYPSARSPTSPASDYHPHYGSPTQGPLPAYYADRRKPSMADSEAPHLPLPAPLPSASSSGESQSGHTSSSVDGYSTAHTTPTDLPPSADNTPRPILPPPPGMPASAIVMPSGFICDYPGCKAAPFHTQYLLSSHQNVHSDKRSHYCSEKGCARSEGGLHGDGGRGFKRKNEMIRHRLVHSSPGYICPYCPDREHKYPRPDNLQRHVRVHHPNKDRDDPVLLEVLAQGTAKTRRRRTNTGGSSSRN